MENKEFTTIQIYREDLKDIVDECKKDENLRDKLHNIIKEWKANGNESPGVFNQSFDDEDLICPVDNIKCPIYELGKEEIENETK